jgi:hypothetical protein
MVGGIVNDSANIRGNLSMASEPSELRRAFVEAFPRYVVDVLGQRGHEVTTTVADAIVEGTAVLDGLLTDLERRDAIDQRHSPLELFREALRPVDHALDVEGVRPDGHAPDSSTPWDRHGLAPGSSQVLGDRAHEAHLRWGVEKAAALAPLVNRPVATVVTTSERFERIAAAVGDVGYRARRSDGGNPVLVIVDNDVAEAHAAIRRATADGVEVVVFGDDLDDLSAPGLRALGARTVVRTDDLLADPRRYLPLIT